MPSHFSTIGFDVPRVEALSDLARRAIADLQTEQIPVSGGRYFHWAGAAGEELWISANEEGNLVGCYPHFSGKARFLARLESRIVRAGAPPLDGAFHAWADPERDARDSGLFPFELDVPDGTLHRKLKLPSIVDAQIAAFAHEITAYDSPDAYYAAPADADVGYASQSFVPFMVFFVDGGTQQPPEAEARISGHVLESALLQNSMSGLSYYWALVETIGGTFDVVIDRSLLQTAPPIGGVLSGTFWLSGRFTSSFDPKRSWLRRRFAGLRDK